MKIMRFFLLAALAGYASAAACTGEAFTCGANLFRDSDKDANDDAGDQAGFDANCCTACISGGDANAVTATCDATGATNPTNVVYTVCAADYFVNAGASCDACATVGANQYQSGTACDGSGTADTSVPADCVLPTGAATATCTSDAGSDTTITACNAGNFIDGAGAGNACTACATVGANQYQAGADCTGSETADSSNPTDCVLPTGAATATCTSSNGADTTITACNAGNFIDGAGAGNACTACAAVGANQYQAGAACTGSETADSSIPTDCVLPTGAATATCTSAAGSDTTITACEAGNFIDGAGAGNACTACATVGENQFQSGADCAGTGTADSSVPADCTLPANAATVTCTGALEADATVVTCNTGFYDNAGVCTAFTVLSCTAGQYEIAGVDTTSDAECGTCTVCDADAGEYETDASVACDGTGTSDTVVCTSCTLECAAQTSDEAIAACEAACALAEAGAFDVSTFTFEPACTPGEVVEAIEAVVCAEDENGDLVDENCVAADAVAGSCCAQAAVAAVEAVAEVVCAENDTDCEAVAAVEAAEAIEAVCCNDDGTAAIECPVDTTAPDTESSAAALAVGAAMLAFM